MHPIVFLESDPSFYEFSISFQHNPRFVIPNFHPSESGSEMSDDFDRFLDSDSHNKLKWNVVGVCFSLSPLIVKR